MKTSTGDRVQCKSGMSGWQCRLRDNYDNNFHAFQKYCDYYNIHGRLGFADPNDAWTANPMIRGSVLPSDLQVVKEN